jgi:hypothetical protein
MTIIVMVIAAWIILALPVGLVVGRVFAAHDPMPLRLAERSTSRAA